MDTFLGVNVTAVDERLKREKERKGKKENKADQEEKKVVPLEATLSAITNQFNLTLSFNKVMNFTAIEPYLYGLFILEVESDGVVHRRSTSKKKRELEACGDECSDKLRFDWVILDVTEREISFKIKFENPKTVSAKSYDKLIFQIVKFNIFQSKEGERLDRTNFKAAKGMRQNYKIT